MAKIEALSGEQLAARVAELPPGWRVEDDVLARDYRTADWKSSMLLASAIGHVAELAWHHPELLVSWGKVSVRLTTHEAGGLSGRDFELAELIEAQLGWRPGQGSTLTGTPDSERWRYLLDQ